MSPGENVTNRDVSGSERKAPVGYLTFHHDGGNEHYHDETGQVFSKAEGDLIVKQCAPLRVERETRTFHISYMDVPRSENEPTNVSGQTGLDRSYICQICGQWVQQGTIHDHTFSQPASQFTGGYTCLFCGFYVWWNTSHDCPRAKENLLRDILTELRALRQELKESKG